MKYYINEGSKKVIEVAEKKENCVVRMEDPLHKNIKVNPFTANIEVCINPANTFGMKKISSKEALQLVMG